MKRYMRGGAALNSFIFALRKELYKLLHKKKYFVFIMLGAAVSIIRCTASAFISRAVGGNFRTGLNVPMEMLPFAADILVPFIVFLAAGDLLTHEYASDTIKMCLIQPLSRFKVLTAKAAAVFITGSGVFLSMFIINTLIQLITGGSLRTLHLSFAAYMIDIIPIAGIVSLGFFVNTALKGPVSSILLSIAMYAAMKYAGIYVSGASAYLFTSVAKLHTILLGHALPLNIILCKFGILAGSILILYSLSYIMFERKNI